MYILCIVEEPAV